MVNFGAIGYGYWGPNVVRNLDGLEGARIAAVSDKSPAARARAQKALHGTLVTPDANDVITAPDIDAVAIITPVWTHFELAKAALENGKHVFVEKPFTASAEQAEELIELAQKKNLTVMVDHTFLFTGAVKKIRELIEQGELGELYYYDSTRVNLGLFQHDIDVIWDLAPHDLSIMDYLLRANRSWWLPPARPLEWPCRRGLPHRLFPRQRHRAYQCELVVSRESSHHAHRRGKKDVGVERFGS